MRCGTNSSTTTTTATLHVFCVWLLWPTAPRKFVVDVPEAAKVRMVATQHGGTRTRGCIVSRYNSGGLRALPTFLPLSSVIWR
jgi:hypothetical protein